MGNIFTRRSTRQRDAIREAISAAGRPLLPAEILEYAQRELPQLGLATVYRNIKMMVEEGELQRVDLPGESARFEPAETGHDHHHHFQCEMCQSVFDVYGCPHGLDSLTPQGFTLERHELTLYGTCGDCARIPPAKAVKT